MRHRRSLIVVAVLFAVGLAWMHGPERSPAGAADAEALPGMATLSGAVAAPKPFKAAQVHLMNVDKNVLFMVYTSGGRYRAPNLFPGTYEVTVRGQGLTGEPQKIQLAAGARETLNFSLREGAPQACRSIRRSTPATRSAARRSRTSTRAATSGTRTAACPTASVASTRAPASSRTS